MLELIRKLDERFCSHSFTRATGTGASTDAATLDVFLPQAASNRMPLSGKADKPLNSETTNVGTVPKKRLVRGRRWVGSLVTVTTSSESTMVQ